MRLLFHVPENGAVEVRAIAKRLSCHPNQARLLARAVEERCSFVHPVGQDVVVSLIPPFQNQGLRRLGEHELEKLDIARKVTEHVSDGDVVSLGGGATVLLLALVLARLGTRNPSVVTRYPAQYLLLLPTINRPSVIGGPIDKRIGTIRSSKGRIEFLEQTTTKSFLGAEGVSHENGACSGEVNRDLQEMAVLRTRGLAAFLADHSQFGHMPLPTCDAFQQLKARSLPFVAIADERYESERAARRVRDEMAKFPEGTVVVSPKLLRRRRLRADTADKDHHYEP
jgi:hypothetical protein